MEESVDNSRQQGASRPGKTSQQRRLHPIPMGILLFFKWYFVDGYRLQNSGSYALSLLTFVAAVAAFIIELVTWSWDKNSIWILFVLALGLSLRFLDGWRRGERIFQ
jgi:hypothetical protein